jgi:hypothetical protein
MTETHVAQRNLKPPEEPPQSRGRRLRNVIVEEVRTLIPAWAFFFLIFLLLRLTQVVALRDYHIHTFPASRVLLGSIVVAKGILLVDLVPFVKKAEKYPLLGVVCLKTLAYVVIVLLFEYIDGLLEFRHEGLAAANRQFGRNFMSFHFWVLQAWLIITVFAYSATRELANKLGRERFHELVFGRSSPA